jgi:hypothetical protein
MLIDPGGGLGAGSAAATGAASTRTVRAPTSDPSVAGLSMTYLRFIG